MCLVLEDSMSAKDLQSNCFTPNTCWAQDVGVMRLLSQVPAKTEMQELLML